MNTAKVEIALRWYISNVCCNAPFLAQLPDLSRGFRVVNGAEHHIRIIEVAGLEIAINV
jgi:hypothetical protein